ncbi:dihydropteroate synthase [Novosphingopyxis sp.]|uniref:dihydropteroate synthase n=1 Tax=Novosphingopyxis sp. TaxID=2709690 RepID=UPI003B5BCD1A
MTLHLRPTAFIDSPQRHDGAAERLAGTMLWFGQVEWIADGGRRLVATPDMPGEIARLMGETRIRAERTWRNLTTPRAPLTLGERVLRLDQPHVMGILNITPDSFSDGGRFADDPAGAAEAGVAMARAGASLIDVGGESTRPGAASVWEGDEIARVQPVIERLARSGTPVSVDTRKAAVMEAALAAGAHMINDISALLHDPRALEAAKASDVPICIMHAPSQGSDPHEGGAYEDAALDVYDWLERRVDAVTAAGIDRARLIVDPGLGFGKSVADNAAILNNLTLYHGLGCPLLIGASRKRMIGALSNEAPADARLGGSLFLAMKAVEAGAQFLRVHDVPETVQAVRVWRGLRDAALTARA